MNKRSKLSNTDTSSTLSIYHLPKDILRVILQPFQESEESLFVSLVCKEWNLIIKRKKISIKNVVSNYATSLSGLRLVRDVINDDRKFFVKPLFALVPSPVLEWALNEIIGKPRTIIRTAARGLARGGHLEALKSLHGLQLLLPVFRLYCPACTGGHLHILKWFKENGYLTNGDTPLEKYRMSFSAGKYGHLHILEWLSENDMLTNDACSGAAAAGNLEILEWLDKTMLFPPVAYEHAASGGHQKVLEWLQKRDWRARSTQITEGAARGGHLEILENESMWSTNICTSAASGGQLELLKYLTEKGLKCDKYTCAGAARAGSLEILQWLRENGCPWNENTTDDAAFYGHLEVLKWALDNGCPYRSTCAKYAARKERWEILKYLHKEGYDLSQISDEAAANGHLDILKWLHENGIAWGDVVFQNAAANGDLEMLKYLYENGYDWKSEGSLPAENAINREQVGVLKWLRGIGYSDFNACVHEFLCIENMESEVWHWVAEEFPEVYQEALELKRTNPY